MSMTILTWSLMAAQFMLAIAMVCACLRMFRGPRAQDRVLAMDSLYLNGMGLMLVFGIVSGSTLYFEAALVIALLGFVSTVALAKFLMRGAAIE